MISKATNNILFRVIKYLLELNLWSNTTRHQAEDSCKNNIKLIDFSLSDNDTFNIFKAPGGTSGYIAPELFLPNAKSDIRCDIYSFGVLASYMAETTHDKRMMQIARQCINHNPEQRPESMAEITIPIEGNSLQIAALVFLSLSALCLLAYIIIRLTQVF